MFPLRPVATHVPLDLERPYLPGFEPDQCGRANPFPPLAYDQSPLLLYMAVPSSKLPFLSRFAVPNGNFEPTSAGLSTPSSTTVPPVNSRQAVAATSVPPPVFTSFTSPAIATPSSVKVPPSGTSMRSSPDAAAEFFTVAPT